MPELTFDTIKYYTEKYKSQGEIGNITIGFTKRFNWFQRFMWKVCFGLKIKNIKEE